MFAEADFVDPATGLPDPNLLLARISVNEGVLVVDTLTSIENVTGTAGDDSITGNSGNNILDGGAGNDIISALGGADTLLGGEGDDTLLPGNGTDTVDGGAGNDTADFSTVSFPVTVNLSTGTAMYVNGAGVLVVDTLTSIENVTGTAGNDSITGDAADNVLSGGGGNDTINGGAGTDIVAIAGTLADVDIAIAGNVATVTIGGNTLTITDGEFLAFNDGTDFEIAVPEVELVGFSVLPADTFAEGPPAGGDNGNGQPISANGRTGPFPGQPVQGFSGVQFADAEGSFFFLADNGFGAQANSTDFLLRIYQVDPDFAGAESGDTSVAIEDFIQLSDPNNLIPFDIINEDTTERLLTGGDFDIESFVIGADGDIWIGDEFGPFILHFDSEGTLLEAPISTPLNFPSIPGDFVRSPFNPEVLAGAATANLGASDGFEGLAFSPDRNTLYPLLEGPVTGDPATALRIYEFDVPSSSFTGLVGFYELEFAANAIGDFTPINDNEFLVIERDNLAGSAAEFKRIYKVDFSVIDADGFVEKELIADLLSIQDPNDLNGDGATSFDFPFVTIEDVLVIDENTIIVANDNNFPFSIGRGPDIDNNEIILLELEQPLNLDPRLGQEAVNDLTSEPVFGTPGDDILEGGLNFDAIRDLLFVGGGADLVDASPVTETIGTGPRNRVYGGTGTDELLAGIADRLFGGSGNDELNSVNGTGGNRLFGGDGDDEITVGSGDRAFGGLGNDILEASLSEGGARLYGGAGDDLFSLGAGDRIVGGDGNDQIFVGQGGNNLITGGAGADMFAIANADIPTEVNTITDFEAGVDTISINGLGLSFANVTLSPQEGDTLVSVPGGNLAVLLNINPNSLSAANFMFG
ncbi:MAG: hypothetical protein HC890_17640 [Chloroflexaceae bacterium]|nr:hypothetical protein [Chloroflexaceae bacterium]